MSATGEFGEDLHLFRKRAGELLDSGRFPLLATIPEEAVADLDGLFEYGLARHLDGFAALVADHARTRP
jgi:hypothetical protein